VWSAQGIPTAVNFGFLDRRLKTFNIIVTDHSRGVVFNLLNIMSLFQLTQNLNLPHSSLKYGITILSEN
jgi:hypothetical protein